MTTKELLNIIAALRERANDLKNSGGGSIIVGKGYSDEDPGIVIRKAYVQELESDLRLIAGQLEVLIPDQQIETVDK